jgi:hypothetical protein
MFVIAIAGIAIFAFITLFFRRSINNISNIPIPIIVTWLVCAGAATLLFYTYKSGYDGFTAKIASAFSAAEAKLKAVRQQQQDSK